MEYNNYRAEIYNDIFLETFYNIQPGLVCTAWQESDGFSCADTGESWKQLDSSIDSSQMDCEIMCRQQERSGCCALDQKQISNTGCWWKSGSTSAPLESAKYKSVTCSFGMLQKFTFYYLNLKKISFTVADCFSMPQFNIIFCFLFR